MTDETGRRWHDMGGLIGDTVNPDTHDFALWEKRVDALRVITSSEGLFSVDGALGTFGNPEVQAYGPQTDKRDLYRVRFTMKKVWGKDAENTDGMTPDALSKLVTRDSMIGVAQAKTP